MSTTVHCSTTEIDWREPQLLCIDISGIIVRPEPMGSGYQAHVEGNSKNWSRGDTVDEAIGSLIRRLAVEAGGANFNRVVRKSPPICLPFEAKDHIDAGHVISPPVGESSFCHCSCGLSFRVGILYTPNPDTEMIIEEAKEALKPNGLNDYNISSRILYDARIVVFDLRIAMGDSVAQSYKVAMESVTLMVG